MYQTFPFFGLFAPICIVCKYEGIYVEPNDTNYYLNYLLTISRAFLYNNISRYAKFPMTFFRHFTPQKMFLYRNFPMTYFLLIYRKKLLSIQAILNRNFDPKFSGDVF